MLVAHANWTEGRLYLWAESLHEYLQRPRHHVSAADGGASSPGELSRRNGTPESHPFTMTGSDLAEALCREGLIDAEALASPARMRIQLPCDLFGPWPSDRIAGAVGAIETDVDPGLGEYVVECVPLDGDRQLQSLLALADHDPASPLEQGQALRYWIQVGRFAAELLANQRFIPTLLHEHDNGLHARWRPWLHDEPVRERMAGLLRGMPPVVRAVVDDHESDPLSILDDALAVFTDGAVRRRLETDGFSTAIEGRDPVQDVHVAWLTGLLADTTAVPGSDDLKRDLLRGVRKWIERLDDTPRHRSWRLCFRLEEPVGSSLLHDFEGGVDGVAWTLHLQLQSLDDPTVNLDARSLWSARPDKVPPGTHDRETLADLLLGEIGRACRLWDRLESLLEDPAPTALSLTTAEARQFLVEHGPLLEESGFAVVAPGWWGTQAASLSARLHLESQATPVNGETPHGNIVASWRIAVGERMLTEKELARLGSCPDSLVRIDGQWVEIEPGHMASARGLLERHADGPMPLLEALRIAWGDGGDQGLPITGVDATGWVADLLDAGNGTTRLSHGPQPKGFHGTLRPYQRRGLDWLAFLDRLGLGACLADDMGLGKTIQLIALLLREREEVEEGASVGPTLLVAPTSVVGNWVREVQRFAPSLTSLVHHGPDRASGAAFQAAVGEVDIVITTYALASRDRETLTNRSWHRVVLDEAQYIKNPPTKQATAIRALDTTRRVALTGTPVENRLTELWSIMDFLNPGHLGSTAEFRRCFVRPIERRRDGEQARSLRGLVRPFILRRLKTDESVIDDLPECVESKEYAMLTDEQAALYRRTVRRMLGEVEIAEGMQRRGLVLATLVRLKQICDHPGLVDGSILPGHGDDDLPAVSERSGKARRLLELLEEVLATGERALIFTQFRGMGRLLAGMIERDLEAGTLFLNGSTPQARRQVMIDRFQSGDPSVPVFLLSLRAGGLGLNLTAANHVFHFDRWWNPAVENQATDRAYRIGQTRTVHVHKFVCTGTLEERIDQMIEEKAALAQHIIGTGEQWLSELSTVQLREMLTLRATAMEIAS